MQHTCSIAGEHRVEVVVFDGPDGQKLDEDVKYFWVLWVELGIKADTTDRVFPDDEPAYTQWWTRTNPQVTYLGPREFQPANPLAYPAWKTGMEYYGVCTPNEWEDSIELLRQYGPCGGRMWHGQDGDQYAAGFGEYDDDTSDSSYRDTDPHSATTWPAGSWTTQEYTSPPSNGVVYDIDPVGYSSKDGDIYRVRANFNEYAEWDGRTASDHRSAHCAASVRWDNGWQVDHTYDGRGDNSAGSGHLGSTDWDLDG